MSDIIFEEKKNIAIITLNREKTLNAWTSQIRKKICNIFSEIKKKKRIKAVIITGSGYKAFCSGQDLNEIKNFKSKNVNKWINEFKEVYVAVRSAEIPVVGAINGVAAGSGFQLALLTDIRVTHSKARKGQVQINSGVVSVIGPWIIEKVLGMSKTIELCLTGKLIDGKEAKKIGIVHYLTKKNKVMFLSLKIAKQLSEKPNKAMKLTKKRIWEMFRKDMNEVFTKAKVYHKKSFDSGEPQKKSKFFLKK